MTLQLAAKLARERCEVGAVVVGRAIHDDGMPLPRRSTQLLIVALLISGCHRHAQVPDGDVTAALTLPSLGAYKLEPASLHGRPTLVLFVSPTCPHCLAELPLANEAARDADANLVAVFVVGKRENAEDIVRTTKFTGHVLIDDGTLRKKYAINSVPYTLVLAADGHACDAFIGKQDASTLKDAIADAR